MVSIRVSGTLVAVKAEKTFRAKIDDMVSFQISSQFCHLFDAKTGARIEG